MSGKLRLSIDLTRDELLAIAEVLVEVRGSKFDNARGTVKDRCRCGQAKEPWQSRCQECYLRRQDKRLRELERKTGL